MIKENQELLENREKLDELDEGGHSRRLAKRNHHPLMEGERQTKCANYGEITFLSVPGKLLIDGCQSIIRRIRRQEQASFM